jgi:hypothetical protein
MAAPVINSVQSPSVAVAGTPYDVVVSATDPAARPVDFTATVANAAGESASQAFVVNVDSGALVYTLTTADPSTEIAAGPTPGSFVVTSK